MSRFDFAALLGVRTHGCCVWAQDRRSARTCRNQLVGALLTIVIHIAFVCV